MTHPHETEKLWYVVFTKAQKELQVVALLEEKGLTVFLPEVNQLFRGKVQLRPLFPNYLFVQLDLEKTAVDVVNYTPGVIKVIANDDKPLPLRNEVIEAIREEVERLNARGGLPREHYVEGELVRLRTGALAGLDAVFVEDLPDVNRAIILLEFLGQENKVTVDLSEIERAPKRRRGTRGKGRKINYDNGSRPRQEAVKTR